MHQKALQGVAHPGPLGLGVFHHGHGHVLVHVGVHVGVAHALEMLEHGHGGGLGHGAHKTFAPTGDDDVNVLVELAQGVDGLMPRHGHKLRGFGGQASLHHGVLERLRQGRVGMQGLAATAQDHGIASLDAQDGRVNGDIGAGLVNHGDDAEGNAHLAHQQAVGALPLAFGGAHRIGQVGDVGAGGAHLFHKGGGEREAVKAGGVLPGAPCGLDVTGVGGQNVRLALAQKIGQSQQSSVFGIGRSPGHGARRVFCLRAKARHFFRWRHTNSL